MSTIFDHLRSDDGEHVGYIEMVGDLFVPHDLLHRRRGEPMELHEAEAVLDTIGLRALAESTLIHAPPLDVRYRSVIFVVAVGAPI